MRVFYLKKTILAAGFLIFSTLLILGMEGLFGGSHNDTTVTTVKPIYQGNNSEKNVALTFNVDWGENVLPDIIEILSEKNVNATFFISGRFAENFPELVQSIEEEGHEIGNHGFYHKHPNKLSKSGNQKEIKDTEDVLKHIINSPVKLYAPPYGECEPSVVEAADEIGYKTIMWTVDTIDWREGRTVDQIKEKVSSKIQNGSIILMHPSPVTAEALPEVIDELKENGYKFKVVSKIISQPGSQNN